MGKTKTNQDFKCKQCQIIVEGSYVTKRGLCAKCRQEVLLNEYMKISCSEMNIAPNDIEKQNQFLLKIIAGTKSGNNKNKIVESSDNLSSSSESDDSNDEDYVPTNYERDGQSNSILWQETSSQTSSQPKVNGDQSGVAHERGNVEEEEIVGDQNDIEVTPTSLIFDDFYRGMIRYHPGLKFNSNIHKCTNMSEDEKNILLKLIEQRKKQIEFELKQAFGSVDAVKVFDSGEKIRYKLKCPVEGCPVQSFDIKKHLVRGKHSWSLEKAKLSCSYRVRRYNYITKLSKRGSPKPVVCNKCNIVVDRIDHHLENIHKMKRNCDEYKAALNEMKQWSHEVLNKTQKRAFSKDIENKEEEVNQPKMLKISSDKSFQRRGFLKISPKKAGSGSILKRIHTITKEQEKKWGISNDLFKRYHTSGHDCLHDFENWLVICDGSSKKNAQQNVQRLKTFWQAIDPMMEVSPNKMATTDNIEDLYFVPLFHKILKQQEDPSLMQGIVQPGTIKAVFSSVSTFLRFLETRQIYVGLNAREITTVQKKLKELKNRLKDVSKQREADLREWKADNLITPQDTEKYGNSEHVQRIIKLFNSKDAFISLDDARHCRNFIMYMITTANACRSSNIVNITLHDIQEATTDENFIGAKVIKSRRYKTSMLYGTKIILLSEAVYYYVQV